MIDRPGLELSDWLESVQGEEWTWYTKRLSPNDTGLTKSNQVGPYIPKPVAFPLLGMEPNAKPTANVFRLWNCWLVSHDQHNELRLIYYMSKNECRLTRFGGKRSPVQDPENTSRLMVFAFRNDGSTLQAWLARSDDEEELIQDWTGQVVPGFPIRRRIVEGQLVLDELFAVPTDACNCAMSDLPSHWALEFPAPTALTAEAVSRMGLHDRDADSRLMRRFECEYSIFRTVEAAHVLPKVTSGFKGVEAFVQLAVSVINRRKSRAGRSLELQLATVFDEEQIAYERQVMTETGSTVDFLFPSLDRYYNAPHGDADIHMLAVKTTLRDRWRQVTQEGRKIEPKHLFTMDEAVPIPQYQDMKSRGVVLVVPQRRVASYPPPIRTDVLTLGRFIELVRTRANS
jgi:type II restriction enzyme